MVHDFLMRSREPERRQVTLWTSPPLIQYMNNLVELLLAGTPIVSIVTK